MAKTVVVEQTGVDEIVRSLGSLIDSTRTLGDKAADIMERELALVVRLSQRVRDDVISAETLERAHELPIPARFREDAHAIVDLVADLGAVAVYATGPRGSTFMVW